jgi:hypothetical protein
MRDLLDLVVASHGGIERWNSIQVIDGDMSITGGLWARKGWPNALEQVHVTARTRDQWISYRPFTAQNKRSRCTPDHTAIETLDGQMIKERHNPRSAFADHTAETKWDDLNLAYFSGFAMWNYLTTPFLLTTPGFETEELAPWSDNGNERRRLKVTFPSSIATHCPEQVFHVDRDNLIARVDYFSQITGGVAAAHYLTDYKDFAGIRFAIKRRAYPRNPDGTANFDRVLVAIDIADIRLS